jgi:hypothetical protein
MTFDPTTNRIPFGLLTPEEQDMLQAWPHGWQAYKGCEWVSITSSNWNESVVYRGKPAPKVKSYWFNIHRGNQIGHIWNSQADASYHATTDGVVMRMDICNGEATVTKET